MGRFASTVAYYSRYREPYPSAFFQQIAERLGLAGKEKLLDIACGPGLLALGFAPYVGHVTGLDPEPAMIAAAEDAATEAGVELSFVNCRIEEFPAAGAFDLVTIGRALHWLSRDAALAVLERIVSVPGRILICGASTVESSVSPWLGPYNAVRRSWSAETDKHDHVDKRAWFAGSSFGEVETIAATERRQVAIPELVGRALSKSTTSPAKLGEGQATFEAEIIAALEPFARDGLFEEEIAARAMVFARLGTGA